MMGGINTCVLILSSLTMALAVRFAQQGRKGLLVLCLWLTMGGAVGFLVIKYFEYSHKIHDHLVWGGTFYEPVDEAQKACSPRREEALDAPLVDGPDEANAAEARHRDVPDREPARGGRLQREDRGPRARGTLRGAGPRRRPRSRRRRATGTPAPGHLADPEMPVGTHLFFGIYFCMTGLHGIHVLIGMGVIGWSDLAIAAGDFGPTYYTPVDSRSASTGTSST